MVAKNPFIFRFVKAFLVCSLATLALLDKSSTVSCAPLGPNIQNNQIGIILGRNDLIMKRDKESGGGEGKGKDKDEGDSSKSFKNPRNSAAKLVAPRPQVAPVFQSQPQAAPMAAGSPQQPQQQQVVSETNAASNAPSAPVKPAPAQPESVQPASVQPVQPVQPATDQTTSSLSSSSLDSSIAPAVHPNDEITSSVNDSSSSRNLDIESSLPGMQSSLINADPKTVTAPSSSASDQQTQQPQSSTNVLGIAVAVVGGFAGFAVLVLFLVRRQKSLKAQELQRQQDAIMDNVKNSKTQSKIAAEFFCEESKMNSIVSPLEFYPINPATSSTVGTHSMYVQADRVEEETEELSPPAPPNTRRQSVASHCNNLDLVDSVVVEEDAKSLSNFLN